MKERPIIFSGPMVRALLERGKTQTRRIVDMTNPHRPIGFLGGEGEEDDPGEWGYHFDGPDHNGYAVLARGLDERHNHGRISIRCPYGEVGDRLWVRETWQNTSNYDERDPDYLHYAADWNGKRPGCAENRWSWRSPVAMPRWASRIILEITEVRVQRLQYISEADARAEGCSGARGATGQMIPGPPLTAREDFERLWGSTNGKRAPWVSNPWVWAITFKRVS